MTIVERIKEKCIENKTTISKLEKELEIGNGVIRRWDERNPGAYQVLKVAEYLNTNIVYLLTGKEESELTPEEKELIKIYRSMNETGKRILIADAKELAPGMPRRSSNSTKIG